MQFNKRYHERFGMDPGILSVYGYDIATIIVRGHLEKDFPSYVHSLSPFDGLAGHYGWKAGEMDIPAGIWVIRAGEFQPARG